VASFTGGTVRPVWGESQAKRTPPLSVLAGGGWDPTSHLVLGESDQDKEVSMSVCMVGWSHTRFGKLDDDDLEALVTTAAADAIADAGLAPADIDEIFLGTFNAGMENQDFAASLVLQVDDSMRFKPATRFENACASGSAALYGAIDAIRARRTRFALVVGVEKMTSAGLDKVTESLAKASYHKEEAGAGLSFPGIFGQLAQRYFQQYGDQSDALAQIAAKNHRNGSVNPLAHLQKDLGFDFCRQVSDKNPIVAAPLKRTDCSTVADGAAAAVLTDVDTALGMEKAVIFRAVQHVNDILPMSRRDVLAMEAPRLAWQRAVDQAGVTLDDLSLAEVHDCFTVAELLVYEAMGLTAEGEGARAIAEGWTEKDGKLPVNPSGGLKSKGHPVGATGVSMHVLAAQQVTGTAGPIQVPGAELAAVFNMGGAMVANYASILQALR
jgi:acetyl-CoA C-acetyltransferase